MKHLIALTLVGAGLVACESGTSELHEVSVSDGVAAQFGAQAPGLLRVSTDRVVEVLCGQTFQEPLQLSVDHGFGCLGDLKGTEVTRTAWVEPAPAAWDPVALCALAGPEPAWRGVDLPPGITGEGYVPSEPEPDWVQAQGTGTWKRDFSPCGGSLKIAYDLR